MKRRTMKRRTMKRRMGGASAGSENDVVAATEEAEKASGALRVAREEAEGAVSRMVNFEGEFALYQPRTPEDRKIIDRMNIESKTATRKRVNAVEALVGAVKKLVKAKLEAATAEEVAELEENLGLNPSAQEQVLVDAMFQKELELFM